MKHDDRSFQSFIETAPDAMVVVDSDGVIRLANRRAETMFGYADHGALLDRPIEDLLPESFGEVHRRHRDEFFEDPVPRPMGAGLDLVARRSDDTEFAVEVSLGLLELDGQNFVSAAVRDITGRVETERQLASSAFIVASSHDAIYAIAPDHTVITWNLGAERLTGRRAPTLIGTRTDHPLCLVDQRLERTLFARASSGEELDRFETELVRADGSHVPVLLTMAAIEDERGRVVGVSGIARDISEEKLAQETLADVQTRMLETQRLARIGLWAYDVDHDEVQWSEELFGITGISPLDFDGSLADHLAPIADDARDEVRNAIEESILTGGALATEYPITRPDGERRWVMTRGDPLFERSGRVVGLRGICQDLTQRQQLIEALQRADALKDEFLGVVSHELRTPLTSIVGFARLLEDRLDDEELAWIEVITRNGEEMHGMVERILDFSRLQGGTVRLTVDVHALDEVVVDVLPLVSSALGSHELVVDLEPGATALVDPSALRRVLVNLLTNAAKFAPAGTEVSLSAHTDESTDEIVIRVSDEGSGIPADELEPIFERFHQVRSNQVAAKRGAGVGLSIVRGYTEMMGGSVEVTSEVGVGSTFTVRLPRSST